MKHIVGTGRAFGAVSGDGSLVASWTYPENRQSYDDTSRL